ncbi:hypothetical protein WR25_16268 [Diploscapter pachys]|uniref:Major facilitator superfamily (MFS) profile domain-containing protein n=1 Tax=Diploscapter pachys TaxID=2018661 RepID=A0A2A2L8E8_9BILA|nr:hypothetical protein WR25_16268 [Diploscapter pachys]
MRFDDFLYEHLGKIGKYQKIQFFLVCLPTAVVAMHALSWTFSAVEVPSRCALPDEGVDSRFFSDSSKLKIDSCLDGENKRVDISMFGNNGITCKYDSCHYANDSSMCERHVYEHSRVYTATERWDLTCQRSWIKATVQASYYVGQMLGSITFGILGDKIGRKKVFCLAIVIQIACGLSLAWAPWWPLYALFRMGTGFAHPGIFVIAVVIGTELVSPRHRRLASFITSIFFSIGQIILGLEAMFITDYRWLHIIIALPDILFLTYYWLVPESARWLVSRRRFEEADKVLQKAAKMNKTTLPSKWWEQIDTFDTTGKIEKQDQDSSNPLSKCPFDKPTGVDESKKHGFADLFRTPEIRKRMLVAMFLWPTVAMVYYGMAMKANVLGGDIYWNFIFAAIIEIPAVIAVYFLIDRIGRRFLIALGFFLAGTCLIANWALSKSSLADSIPLAIVQMLITKGSIAGTYTAIYTYTPELFPTPIRNTAMGCCSTIARVGAITASYVAFWIVERFGKVYMIIPFGILAVTAALLTIIFLPETMGKHLPDTIEEVESQARKIRILKANKVIDSRGHKLAPIDRPSVQVNDF